MDANRFDTLTRALHDVRSRRAALAAVLAGTLGLLGLDTTVAKKGHGHHKKKRKKNGNPTGQPPPSGSCADGIKNGSESDVDCGGSCPRCASTKSCASRNDCVTALCNSGTCSEPTVDADCGSDSRGGQCYAAQPWTSVSKVCVTASQTGPIVDSCASCPPGTNCLDYFKSGFSCYKPCDAP